MCAHQPLAQVTCGFIGGHTVERHQRRRDTRDPDDVGAPAVSLNGSDLDLVRATTNGFLETMNDRVHYERSAANVLCEGTDGIVTRLLHSNKRSAVRNDINNPRTAQSREN
mgnify:FL=1